MTTKLICFYSLFNFRDFGKPFCSRYNRKDTSYIGWATVENEGNHSTAFFPLENDENEWVIIDSGCSSADDHCNIIKT